MAEISPLRRRMIEDMTVRNFSPATQRSYLHAVSNPHSRRLTGFVQSGFNEVATQTRRTIALATSQNPPDSQEL